ncbi:MAG TPA: DUF4270 family protein [Cytophagaceae bacterium]
MKKITLKNRITTYIRNFSIKNIHIGCMLLLASTLFSCDKEPEIGLDSKPVNNPLDVAFVELPVKTSVFFHNDSVITSNAPIMMVGAYKDNEFGNVYAEGYAELTVKGQDENRNVAGATVLDAYLTLDYYNSANENYTFYGDTNQTQTLLVYKILDNLYKDSIYYNSTPSPNKEANFIGQHSFQARPYTPDSRILIDIPNSLAQDILNLGTITQANLLSVVKGLAIVPQDKDKGAVLGIDLANDKTNLTIQYKLGEDTLSLQFPINGNSGRFHKVRSERGGTLLSSLTNIYDSIQTSLTGNTGFIQSGVGLKSVIKIPGVQEFKQDKGTVLINKAELVVYLKDNSASQFNPPGDLYMVEMTSGGALKRNNEDLVYVQTDNADINGTANPLRAIYSETTNSYTFSITSYFQALLYENKENNGIVLTPNALENKTSVSRMMFYDGSENNPSDKKLKLRVYYTVIK